MGRRSGRRDSGRPPGPRGREASTAALSILVGSLAGIVIFGTGVGFSLADETVLNYLLTALIISGVCLLVLAALGGMLAAVVRDSQEGSGDGAAYGRDQPRGGRGYREPPDRF